MKRVSREREREAHFAYPNRRACSQANVCGEASSDGGHFDFHIVKGTRGEWKRAEFKNPWGVGTLDG